MNKSALDRGLFRSTSVKKYSTTIQKNQSTSQDDVFIKPDRSQVIGMRQGTYDKLNEKGFAPEETVLENGDILIGKVSPIQPVGNSNKVFKDSSEYYKSNISGVVDKVYTDIYNNEGYEMRKVRVRSERKPEVGDKFCIANINTDVLTSIGWIKINEILKTHKIATLTDNKYLEYVNPIDVYNFKYRGAVYKLRSQQIDLDVTIDHELYVKKREHKNFELIPAFNVYGKRMKFKKWAENKNPDIEFINITKNRKIKMDDLLDLLGIFISDGCIESNNIIISGAKLRKIKHLQDIVKKLNLKILYDQDNHGDFKHLNNLELGMHHYINDNELASFFEPYSVGAINKFLPEFVWKLSQRQSRLLLESLISGDGSHNNQGSVCYYTSSKRLADDVMKLAIHAGWSGSIKLIRPKGTAYEIKGIKGRISKGFINEDALSVRIIKTKNEPEINHGHIHEQNGQSEELYAYEGDVYCLEVPSHVFMIRQNGKNVWVGNCSRH